MNAMSTYLTRLLVTLTALCAMSAAAFASDLTLAYADGTLVIWGTEADDNIVIDGSLLDGLTISMPGIPGSLITLPGEVTALEVRGGAGDDTIINISDIPMTAYGAAGDDYLECADEGACELYGQAGDDELFGGTGADYMDGGKGADVVSGDGDDTCVAAPNDDVTCEDSSNGWDLTQNDKL